MKKILGLILMLLAIPVCAASVNKVRSVPSSFEDNLVQTTQYLIRGESNPYEKAKVIAIWIASHITYDTYDYAAAVGRKGGYNVSNRLETVSQAAEDVFKTRLAVCEGYANLYAKMLSIAGIKSKSVTGFVQMNASSSAVAKHQIRKDLIAHVWTQVHLPTGDILVDTTWMGKGKTATTGNNRLTPQMYAKEIRRIAREKPTHDYDMRYFDFKYRDLQAQGEYRFDQQKQLLRR